MDALSALRHVDGRDGQSSLARSLVAEALGTAFLLIAIVGSGILGERLAGGNAALALLPMRLRPAPRSMP